jgi:hypothetical protein
MYVIPKGRNTDVTLHRDRYRQLHLGVWTLIVTFVKPDKRKDVVSCKSAILLICSLAWCPRFVCFCCAVLYSYKLKYSVSLKRKGTGGTRLWRACLPSNKAINFSLSWSCCPEHPRWTLTHCQLCPGPVHSLYIYSIYTWTVNRINISRFQHLSVMK